METEEAQPPPMPEVDWGENPLARVFSDPIQSLRRLHEAHGPIVSLVDGAARHVFVFGPDYNRQVLSQPLLFLTTEDESLPALSPQDSAIRRLGEGILAMNGARHRQQRALLMQAFAKGRIEAQRDAVVALTEGHLARWRPGQEVDALEEMRQLVLALSMWILFGLDAGGQGRAFSDLMHRYAQDLFKIAAPPPPAEMPGSAYERLLQLAEAVERALHALIARKRDAGAGDDVLSLLLHARDEDGNGMTDAELAAQSLTLFIAGHESTASALSWVLFLLAQHPQTADAVLDELDGALHGAAPASAQLEKLALLDGVIKESLRLFPAGLWGLRVTAAPVRLGGYVLPAHTKVIYSEYITHRLPELYPEPQRFLPERWRTLERALSPYEYLPFSAGPRMCIGAVLVLWEMKIVLAVILQRHRLALRPGATINRGRPASDDKALPMIVHAQDRRFTKETVQGNVRELVDLD